MGESNKRALQDMSKSFADAAARTPKKSKEGSISENTSTTSQEQQNPSPICTSTPTSLSTNGYENLDPHLQQLNPGFQQHYVLNGPLTLSPEDILKIAEAVREGIREYFREEISCMIEEKVAPLREELDHLRKENNDMRRQIDELEQYGRRPLIRVSGIPETEGENTSFKLLEATSMAGIELTQDDIVNSHRVGNPKKQRPGPHQIIARLKSVDTKFHVLRNSSKFRENEETMQISVNEDLTKFRDRLLFLCRQLCRKKHLKSARSSNGKITVKDNSDKYHHIRDESDLVKFGHEIQEAV